MFRIMWLLVVLGWFIHLIIFYLQFAKDVDHISESMQSKSDVCDKLPDAKLNTCILCLKQIYVLHLNYLTEDGETTSTSHVFTNAYILSCLKILYVSIVFISPCEQNSWYQTICYICELP